MYLLIGINVHQCENIKTVKTICHPELRNTFILPDNIVYDMPLPNQILQILNKRNLEL